VTPTPPTARNQVTGYHSMLRSGVIKAHALEEWLTWLGYHGRRALCSVLPRAELLRW
jgi:hypothetical protein